MKKIAYALLFSSLFAISAHAEIEPVKGIEDNRVRQIVYNPLDIIRVQTFFGVRSLIRLPSGEKIIDQSGGDPKAWNIPDHKGKSYLWVQPIEDNPDTNYIVITEDSAGVQRDYNFIFTNVYYKDGKTKRPFENANLTLTLKIIAADDVKTSEKNILIRQKEAEKEQIKKELNPADPLKTDMPLNFDYWACGDELIKPTSVYDNGLFTVLTFANSRAIPAVHEVKADGSEALIYHSMSGLTTMVIPKVINKVVLRLDPYVSCVQNYSYDPANLLDFTSGTSSNKVIRELKAQP